MVQTAEGAVFQPNPTTVTVVPPARSIQVVGGPEGLGPEEYSDVQQGPMPPAGVLAEGQIPQMLPQQAPIQMIQRVDLVPYHRTWVLILASME